MPGWAEFWDAYPNKVAKRTAAAAYRSALKRGADPAVLIKAAMGYRDDPARDSRYTKHPATWLNGDCWSDEPERHQSATDRRVAQAQALKTQLRGSQGGVIA